jgi:hypothetical protein
VSATRARPDARARLVWLEAALTGIEHQLAAMTAELRAALATPEPMDAYERRVARKLWRQLQTLADDCDLIRAQLAHLRRRRAGGGLER